MVIKKVYLSRVVQDIVFIAMTVDKDLYLNTIIGFTTSGHRVCSTINISD